MPRVFDFALLHDFVARSVIATVVLFIILYRVVSSFLRKYYDDLAKVCDGYRKASFLGRGTHAARNKGPSKRHWKRHKNYPSPWCSWRRTKRTKQAVVIKWSSADHDTHQNTFEVLSETVARCFVSFVYEFGVLMLCSCCLIMFYQNMLYHVC